ncbi:MAG: glycosyltransferase family 4 protein [Gammaproteobacteria bacterium]|nr:glycosyltransferase family 4 protein [Gammaproteobacteria bacterium]
MKDNDRPSPVSVNRRILCVTSNFPRWDGDSTTPFVLNLAADLQQLGWTVDVLAPHAPGAALAESLGGVRVERFRYLYPESAQDVCYQGGALINIRKSRVKAMKLPVLVVAEWAAVIWRLLSRRYDAVHFHWILPQGFVGAVSAKLLRVPYVITVHGGDVFALKGRILRTFKRLAVAAADAITVNSSATERAVRELDPGVATLARIPMGVTVRDVRKQSESVATIRRRYRRAEGPLLVFVGRLVDEKGCADLIEAARLLAEDFPGLTALVIGEGQDRQALEQLAAALGVADRVSFPGWVQPEEVLDHIAAADVFVGPSRTGVDGWVEAQGLTFLEAMVARTPVVASRVGGIVDSVLDGQTGLLVDEKSPAQIATAVRRILQDSALRDRLVAQAFDNVVARFSRAASAEHFSSLFADLVAKR